MVSYTAEIWTCNFNVIRHAGSVRKLEEFVGITSKWNEDFKLNFVRILQLTKKHRKKAC